MPDAKGKDSTRTVLKLPLALAPNKCAVLPLLKNKEEKYVKKYAFKPSPIASLHYGGLVRAEIGKIKTQIIFQGSTFRNWSRSFLR